MELAAAQRVEIVHERVTGVERKGRILVALRTADGLRVSAKCFIDASGSGSSFLGREFQSPSTEYGPRKVAIRSYFKVSDWQEGTTLYASAPERQYMEWVWEIPTNPETVSIGYVSTGAAIKRKREQSLSVQEIFAQELAKFDRLGRLLREQERAGGQGNVLHLPNFSSRLWTQLDEWLTGIEGLRIESAAGNPRYRYCSPALKRHFWLSRGTILVVHGKIPLVSLAHTFNHLRLESCYCSMYDECWLIYAGLQHWQVSDVSPWRPVQITRPRES